MLGFAKKWALGWLVLYLCAVANFAQTPAARIVVRPGIIILLNGTGSAGKSSIGRVLERSLENAVFLNEETLVFNAYNHFLTLSQLQPPKPLVSIREMITYVHALPRDSEALFRRAFKANGEAYMKADTGRLLKEFTGQGKGIIIDRPMWTPEQLEEWKKETQGIPVFHVVVYCPLDAILERLQARNSSQDVSEHRDIALPFELFFHMYQVSAGDGVDRLTRAAVEEDLRKAIAYKKAYTGSDDALKSERFIQDFLAKFRLDPGQTVTIAPFFDYDMAVNTGTTSSQECAVQIEKRLILWAATHPGSSRCAPARN